MLDLVPPSVQRLVGGRPASLTWWVDGFAMNELDRRRKAIDPPDPRHLEQASGRCARLRRVNLEHLPGYKSRALPEYSLGQLADYEGLDHLDHRSHRGIPDAYETGGIRGA